MAFGEPVNSASFVRICCGARCGQEPGHRALYQAGEQEAKHCGLEVRPAGCQAMCGLGVTVILPDGERYKAQETQEVRHQIREYTERKLRQSDNENEEVT